MLQASTAPPSRRNRRPRGGVHTTATLVSNARSRPWILLLCGVVCLASVGLLPLLVLEQLDTHASSRRPHLSVDHLLQTTPQLAKQRVVGGAVTDADQQAHPLLRMQQQQQQDQPVKEDHVLKGNDAVMVPPRDEKKQPQHQGEVQEQQQQGKMNEKDRQVKEDHVQKENNVVVVPPNDEKKQPQHQGEVEENNNKQQQSESKQQQKQKRPLYQLDELQDTFDYSTLSLARGVAGLPSEDTPALEGAQRAHIQCTVSKDDSTPFNVDSLAYWNDPQGQYDQMYQSPFSVKSDTSENATKRYITFNADAGGWNNIRMSMEIIFVIAAATNRILVLPPKEKLYLLDKGSSTSRHRGFADFFPLEHQGFQKHVTVMSMADFLQQPEIKNKLQQQVFAPNVLNLIETASVHCENRLKSENSCQPLRDFLQSIGTVPNINALETCLIFDKNAYVGNAVPASTQIRVKTLCGKRNITYWNAATYRDPLVLHFRADHKQYRLLAHFYAMIHFTSPRHDHHYKRFVRDFLHYRDEIFCAAGKIVAALRKEAAERHEQPNFSALHVRRGDLQYKVVKLSAQKWYENTQEVWLPNELLYIATDERNKTFFQDLAQHHELRFLDDYWDLAGLKNLDGNYMGMIDTIVASRGRAFAGTWFSTFSGYINRMRGYHGMSMKDSWYSFLPKKNATHEWDVVSDPKYAYEWPDGWVGIDGDKFPNRDKF